VSAVRSRPERPVVVIASCGDPAALREVRAGLEEEGVPAREEPLRGGEAVALAHEAACRSPLDVGIGIAADGAVCVHHAKLSATTPALLGNRAAARVCGHNAARIVVGIPLKELPADQ